MAKVKATFHENYRIAVDVDLDFYWAGLMTPEERHASIVKRLEAVAAEIRRHADHVLGVSVLFGTVYECEHCGGRWAEGNATSNQCCNQDVDEEDARQARASAPEITSP